MMATHFSWQKLLGSNQLTSTGETSRRISFTKGGSLTRGQSSAVFEVGFH